LVPGSAWICAGVEVLTAEVVTGNETLVAPAGTVTLDGILLTELMLVSATETPPDGAGDSRVIVPCAVVPPTTALWLSVKADAAPPPAEPSINDRGADHGL
jgi:hypothetical protein